ncbi:MAG: tRNA uridine-5-carboxymethylaminomethyl(34) synthesis GTPase MnmE [Candidatus Cryptobacteroides sp.]
MYFSKNDDTICAPATIAGTGAISIIRVSGKDALTIADKVIHCRRGTLSEASGYTIKFGTVSGGDGRLIDEVLVSVFKAPHSYTGENSVEISCHASSYIVSRLVGLLIEAGARAAEPGEFTQRAFLNGKMDLAQAEAVADVIASQNAAAHRIAFTQMKGGFSKELQTMRDSLLEIVTLMELELDFSEEDVEFADRTRLKSLLDGSLAHISRLIDSFRAGNAIKNGVPTAIAGATNTGKSTLLNALLGEDRAIVSDIHGTTRDTIEETLDIDGVLFRFIDTAGLRETDETVEKIGIERTMKKISDASVVLAMTDAARPQDEALESLETVLSKVDPAVQKVMILVNKRDAVPAEDFQNRLNSIVSFLENKGLKAVSQETCRFDGNACIKDAADCEAPSAGGHGQDIEDSPETVLHHGTLKDVDGNGHYSEGGCLCAAHSPADGVPGNHPDNSPAPLGCLSGLADRTPDNHPDNLPAPLSCLSGLADRTPDNHPDNLPTPLGCFSGPADSIPDNHPDNSPAPLGCLSGLADRTPDNHPDNGKVTVIGLSAKTGEGTDILKSLLASSQKDLLSDPSATLVTNTRHLEALSNARSALERVRTSLDTSLPTDLISQDLREALHHLGTITGEISTDEVLGRIFAGFCIGK